MFWAYKRVFTPLNKPNELGCIFSWLKSNKRGESINDFQGKGILRVSLEKCYFSCD